MQRVDDQSSPSAKLLSQVESWRSRLLDIGNRNPLIWKELANYQIMSENSQKIPSVITGKHVLHRFDWYLAGIIEEKYGNKKD